MTGRSMILLFKLEARPSTYWIQSTFWGSLASKNFTNDQFIYTQQALTASPILSIKPSMS